MKIFKLFVAFTVICLALVPRAEAVVPPPDGGYPNFTTAEGTNALQSLTTGAGNTAVGWHSLFSNTEGSFNTATGAGALLFNTANENTAFGAAALLFNTNGFQNTAVGAAALLNNTSFNVDTPNGGPGSANTAVGARTLTNNLGGGANTAIGSEALSNNISGASNTVVGAFALLSNTAGSNNTVLGVGAGSSLTTGNNNIDIGNTGVAGESDTMRIGSEFQTRTFISAIRGVTTGIADAVNVVIDSNGQLGTMSSSHRFKKEIRAMDTASEAILALKPVTFHYKSDTKDTPQFGLIAEEVAEVNPNLVVRDKNGEIYTVRYDAVNAMLLNEFLKAHRKIQELEANNARQERSFAKQQEQIDALSAALQKVSAQLEVSKASPRTVLNSQ